MKTIEMKLQEKFFNFIKSGTKRIELRLYDEKRKQIELGDEIEFAKNDDDGDRIRVKVVGLLRYASFEELFRDFDIKILADEDMTKNELLTELGHFYSEEKQKEYGVLGIRFELV